MLKRLTGVKFHAKELLKREAINVFTEIWVSPFYTWNLSTFTGEISPLLHPPFNRCFQICRQKERSPAEEISIVDWWRWRQLQWYQQSAYCNTMCADNTNFTQYRHWKCQSFDLPLRCITLLSCECRRPFHVSATATFMLVPLPLSVSFMLVLWHHFHFSAASFICTHSCRP